MIRFVVAIGLVAGGLLMVASAPAAADVVDPDVPCPETAQQNPTTPVGFEIDGNCQVDVDGNLDWQSPEVGTQPVAGDGLSDGTQYTGGSGETNWPNWSQGSGIASGQADIVDIYSFSTLDNTGTQAWQVLAFSRGAGSGSIGYALELNQAPNQSDNPAIPERTEGDWRFNLTQTGNAPLALTNCHTWTAAGAWSPVACRPAPSSVRPARATSSSSSRST